MAGIKSRLGAPGEILKAARKAKNYTKEQVAEHAKISIRYLTAIENEGRKPSYDVLCRLIRCIGISADLIFYPDKEKTDTDDAQLVRLIGQCSARDRKLLFVLVNQMLVNGDAKS